MIDQLPRRFEEALAWAKKCVAETGEMPTTISNPTAGLVFDLEKATITRAVWDEDNNLVEIDLLRGYWSCAKKADHKAKGN